MALLSAWEATNARCAAKNTVPAMTAVAQLLRERGHRLSREMFVAIKLTITNAAAHMHSRNRTALLTRCVLGYIFL